MLHTELWQPEIRLYEVPASTAKRMRAQVGLVVVGVKGGMIGWLLFWLLF